MRQLKLLDAYCGAGGCTKGYQNAGFYVVGVDINPQPRYVGNEFFQGDAFEFIARYGHEFDAIHASPRCQKWTKAQRLQGNDHPDQITPIRKLLQATGKPYVIENVPGAPLINPVLLIGTMFDLLTIRPRLFECSFEMPLILAPMPGRKQAKMGRPPNKGEYIQVVGHFSGVEYAKRAMGIDWMIQKELSQAIPPAYTEFIGRQMIEMITERVK